MRLPLAYVVGVATVLAAAACGGGQAAPPPAPLPNQDSINAARLRQQQATQDSIARAQARRDSLERARLETERIRRQQDSLAATARETEAVKAMLARPIHFDFDRSNIRVGEDTQVLNEKLGILQANPRLSLELVGHADERGSDEYNLALGNRRAVAARQYLVSRGIAANRITTRSMGEEQPVDPGHTETAWALNRRDEFAVTAGGDALRRPGM